MIRLQNSIEGARFLFIYYHEREILAIDSANDPNDISAGGLYRWIFLCDGEEYIADDFYNMDIDENTGRLKIIGVDLV